MAGLASQSAIALKPRLILGDLGMPHLSGTEVCKRLRARGFKDATHRAQRSLSPEIDKVKLLDIGADDYVVKPFGVRELLARIRAVLRRTSPLGHSKSLESERGSGTSTRRVVRRAGQGIEAGARRV